MEKERLIWKDEFGTTHSTNKKINGKFVGDKDIRAKLYKYEQEESEGRLIHLPCKPGDTIFYIVGNNKKIIKSAKVREVTIGYNGRIDLFVEAYTSIFKFLSNEFYLTKEEAEQALKKEN